MPETSAALVSKRPMLGVTDESKLSDLVRIRQKRLKASCGGVGDGDAEEDLVPGQFVEVFPQDLQGLSLVHVSSKKI